MDLDRTMTMRSEEVSIEPIDRAEQQDMSTKMIHEIPFLHDGANDDDELVVVTFQTVFFQDVGLNIASFLEVQGLLRLSETDKTFNKLLSGEDPHKIWCQVKKQELSLYTESSTSLWVRRRRTPPPSLNTTNTDIPFLDHKVDALRLCIRRQIRACTNRLHLLYRKQVASKFGFDTETGDIPGVALDDEPEMKRRSMEELPDLLALRSRLESALLAYNDPRVLESKAYAAMFQSPSDHRKKRKLISRLLIRYRVKVRKARLTRQLLKSLRRRDWNQRRRRWFRFFS